MKKIETRVYLKLHEAVTISTLLSASETWSLTNKEYNEMNKMELWALKRMFGLPPTTPTPAVVFATGTLYAEIRVKKRQLIYLQKVLQKEEGHWAKEILQVLRQNNIGWVQNVEKTLEDWGLEIEWDSIKNKSRMKWKEEVEQAAEKMNRMKLREDCHIKERKQSRQKTKTQTIIDKIDDPNYSRKPLQIMNNISALETRALLMGRYGMLSCRANFSMGTGNKDCIRCAERDDMDHRINRCINYRDINLYDSAHKLDTTMIFSDEIEMVRPVIQRILSMWDLEHEKNTMRQ